MLPSLDIGLTVNAAPCNGLADPESSDSVCWRRITGQSRQMDRNRQSNFCLADGYVPSRSPTNQRTGIGRPISAI
jgi:hypothetical protein